MEQKEALDLFLKAVEKHCDDGGRIEFVIYPDCPSCGERQICSTTYNFECLKCGYILKSNEVTDEMRSQLIITKWANTQAIREGK